MGSMESFTNKVQEVKVSPHETSPKDEDLRLEKEFAQRLFLDLKEENLEYAIVNPAKNIENAEKINPIIFIGGFATTKEQYKGEIINLAKLGKTVIFVNPDKGITPNEEGDLEYFSKMKDSLPSSIVRKATAVSALIKFLNINQADVVGNSQGAAVAVSLVGAHPKIAKRLVLDCPSGLIGKGSASDLRKRAKEDAIMQKKERPKNQDDVDPVLREYNSDVWKKYYRKVWKNLFWRLTKEMPDISKIDLIPALTELKANRKAKGIGPEIVLFNANNDVVFPKDKIEKTLGLNGREESEYNDTPFEFIDRWAMYKDVNKMHTKYTQPQPGDTPEKYFSPHDSVLHQLFEEDIQK